MVIDSDRAEAILDEWRLRAEAANGELLALHGKGVDGGILWDAAKSHYHTAIRRVVEIEEALEYAGRAVGGQRRMVFLAD
jgi:hypothetical protein